MENLKYTFHFIHHSLSQTNTSAASPLTGTATSNSSSTTNTNSNATNATGSANVDDTQLGGGSLQSNSSQSTSSTNENELYEQKLLDITDQLMSSGHSQASILSNLNIEQVVVSSQYLAFLLDNGRVCRVNYQYNSSNPQQQQTPSLNETNLSSNSNINSTNSSSSSSRNVKHSKLSSNLTSNVINSTNTNVTNGSTLNSSSSASSSFRQSQSSNNSSSSRNLSSSSFVAAAAAAAVAAATNTITSSSGGSNNSSTGSTPSNLTSNLSNSNAILRANEAFIIPSPHDILSSSSLSHTFGRGRRNQLLRGRVSNLIVGSSRIPPFVPASAVPESLIESVQTVLQSKSRSVIVRELQRTNLDVNLAVNNLLQRDDEGDDPTDDEDPYMHGDDLISLLDINSHHGENVLLEADPSLFDEDSFRLSRRLGSSRSHSSNNNNSNSNTANVGIINSSTNSNSNSNANADTSERDTRKSSYRIRDQRWYDSYRDELFSSSSSSHHHHHRHPTSSSSSSDPQSNLNDSKTDDYATKKSSILSNTNSSGSSNTNVSNAALSQTKTNQPNFSFGESLQYWTDKNNEPIKFVKIAAMYSELVGLSHDGRLHQWKWSSDLPFSLTINLNLNESSAPTTPPLPSNQVVINHPKTLHLQLLSEKVCGLSTSCMRAACWTESGKIAAWLDESVDIPSTLKYQTQAQNFFIDPTTNTLINDRILDMSTSNLFTIIRMHSGAIYWWGIMPFEQRAKLIDKYNSKSQKSKSNSLLNEIQVGCYVSLKSLPLYNIGTIGITVKDGQPKIGQLNEHVFGLRDCKSFKFKLKTPESFKDSLINTSEMPPPPSPSEQPIQQQQQQQPLTGSLKRKKQYLPNELSPAQDDKKSKLVELYDEEAWNLNDVVLVEDSKSAILGKVIKVDNDYILVKMQSKPTELNTPDNSEVLDNSRIFLKNQLQLVKQSSSSKLPDFMQKTPKKISDFGLVLAVAAQQNGLHAIISKENALFYVQIDLASNKIVKEKRFTTSLGSFLGKNPNNISFFTQDDPNFNILTLIDGNSTFYPLIELSGSSILKDPQWKNLFQIKCFSQCILPMNNDLNELTGNMSPSVRLNRQTNAQNSGKKLQFVSFFVMRMEQLMTSIFRYDLNRVTKILRQLEAELIQNSGGSSSNLKRLKRILNERCDGNRNILHAAVFICAPTSNNNISSDSTSSTNASTTTTQSSRSNKFDSNTYTDIYATYGSTQSSSFLTKPSSSTTIERPWSTTSSSNTTLKHDLSVRKITIESQPQTQTDTSSSSSSGVSSKSNDSNSDSQQIPTSFWPPLPPTEQTKSSYQLMCSPVKLTDKEKRQNAIKILEELLISPLFQLKSSHTDLNCLCDMLTYKSADGLTPFMYAVSLRAYDAALLILDTALKIRTNLTHELLKTGNLQNLNYKRDILFTNIIFPIGSRTDQSPLFVLCSNDTCSFTWTGDNHITQDIFECRTCTLVGNLCCCTECARTCHKGHDCKIKTSSPTAYCDCWEKCKCKSLIAGDQEKRFKLLDKLLAETNLLVASSSRGESLLIYLVQTVGRQIQEQRNYKRHCGSQSSRRYTGIDSSSSSSTGQIGDMPQHDLEPPKFCRRALERIFTDWYSIKQIFLFNNSRFKSNDESGDDEDDLKQNDPFISSLYSHGSSLLFDESAYVDAQSGCVDLDKFIYLLIMKCPSDLLTLLVETIQTNLNDSNDYDETSTNKQEINTVVRRFIRSVARLFVVLCIETSPSNLQLNLNLSTGNTKSKNNNLNSTTNKLSQSKLNTGKTTSAASSSSNIASLVTVSPIAKCEYILRQFSKYSIDELANVAHSLVAPVILGITKPSTFKLSILSNHLNSTGSNNITFNNSSSNSSNTDYSSSNANSLAEELFNLEPPIQRLFSTAISTTLLMPTPRADKAMLLIKQEPPQFGVETPNLVETNSNAMSTSTSTQQINEETNLSEASSSALIQTKTQMSQDDDVQTMPPPLLSNPDASNPPTSSNQLTMFVESDNNSNSSTASNSSTNRARNPTTSSKTSSKQRHGAHNYSTRDGSNSSKSSGSSNASNDSNHSTSSSSSSSSGSDVSSDTNSNDTAITESSASTSNTKRSTVALKNGRTGQTDLNTTNLAVNRRVTGVNFVDPFSLILLGSRNSASSIDVNIGDDSASSITNQSISRRSRSTTTKTNRTDLDANSNKIETASVNSTSSITTVNDSTHPARSIASYFTDEDDDDNEDDDEDDEDELDQDDDNSNDLSTTNDDEFENDDVLDTRSKKNKSKRKRMNKQLSKETNLTTSNTNPNLTKTVDSNQSSATLANVIASKIEEELDNEDVDDEDDVEEDEEDEDENDEDLDEDDEDDDENLDEFDQFNDDENMETSQDNIDLTVIASANSNVDQSQKQDKKKPKLSKINYLVSTKSKPDETKPQTTTSSNTINSTTTKTPANLSLSTIQSLNEAVRRSSKLQPTLTQPNQTNLVSTQIAPNPTTLYSPSSTYQRTTSSTNRTILPNSDVSQRRHAASSSAINTIIQQYNQQNQTAYEQQRINIINSINQPSSPSVSNPPPSTSSHHLSLGDYYYAAHNIANLNNNNSTNNSTTNSSFSNILNNNLLVESHRNTTSSTSHHHHHHHNHHTIVSNSIPTSNTQMSGQVAQTDLVSSFNTPSSVSLTNNTLARVFSILVKLIRDLFNTMYLDNTSSFNLKDKKKKKHSLKQLSKLIKRINNKLESPWQWLISLMDYTESQLRFGASLSASQMNELSTSATQYLRHLEEKALLTNYFNNYNSSNQNNYGYYSANNLVSSSGSGGPFISSRFGSGIDARRKLNIMQHQHQQFASLHLNQSYQHYNASNQMTSGFNANNIARTSSQSNQDIIQPNTSQQTNQNNAVASLASQFAASQVISTRKDFMSYALSLMRSQTNEHRDSLPSIDISSLKHVAYIFDGILFYLKSNLSITSDLNETNSESEDSFDENDLDYEDEMIYSNDLDSEASESNETRFLVGNFDDDDDSSSSDSSSSSSESETNLSDNETNDDDEDNKILKSVDLDENSIEILSDTTQHENASSSSKRKILNDSLNKPKKKPAESIIKKPCTRASSFFKRSNSTLCLGAQAPDPFAHSLDESIPLASKPHLLQPHSRIQDMFKIKSNNLSQFMSLKSIGLMSYNLRSKTPNLLGPHLIKSKTNVSPTNNITSNKREETKKKSNFMAKFEKRLFKLADLNEHRDLSQAIISKPNSLIDRWRLTVDLFGRVFCDDVGLESGSIIRQLGGFQLKEAKFRREMERLRNIASRELLMEVERDRDLLLLSTFKSLNNMYNVQSSRRAAAAASMTSSSSSQSNLLPPPLCLNRIKVTFKDEQGEGSGVARSFYTAFAEAVLADQRLPPLESCFYTQTTSTSSNQNQSSVSYVPFNMIQRYRNSRSSGQGDLITSSHRRSVSNSAYSAIPISPSSVMTRASIRLRDQLLSINSVGIPQSNETNESQNQSNHPQQQPNSLDASVRTTPSINQTTPLSVNAPAFFSPLIAINSPALNDLPNFDLSFYNSLDMQHREIGQQLFAKISNLLTQQQQSSLTPVNTFKAAKITGMLLELRSNQIQQLLSSDALLKLRFDEACALLSNTQSNETNNIKVEQQQQHQPTQQPDDTPLFWQPDKTMAGAGFYSPRPGLQSSTRLNAFRNVGRIMAICLLQNELCPITLSRHVIKYILNRPIRWHDLAFFDSQMYESFRKMICDAEKHLVNAIVNAKESSKIESKQKIRQALLVAITEVNEQIFKPLDLSFNIDLPKEEGGTNNDLIENGSKIEVNAINMYEYVKRYAEFRMVNHVELCLQELKSGIYDVLPANALEGLTAEDFRLLLNGVADINIHTLASYTTISDESKESSRRAHFEKWFWSTLEKMNQQEKQELLFFWTGSPYLPASEEGFQPLPTITLRPPSDQHLPTANTCINRLYLPMYSSKSILKSKILQAIKTKTFGFV